jgi:hypothetical protein
MLIAFVGYVLNLTQKHPDAVSLGDFRLMVTLVWKRPDDGESFL